MNIDATKIVMTVACWMTFNDSHAEELPSLPIPIAESEERQVILPWEGVRPWKFKNEDPWHGYPDEAKPKPTDRWGTTVLRFGRPTDDLDANVRFYRDGLGFPIIMGFELHDGFKGAMFGLGEMIEQHPETIHLEITQQYAGSPGEAPSDDNNLVFYIRDWTKIMEIANRLLAMGFKPLRKSRNPWWDAWCSITFPDPDGWNIVLHPKQSGIDHSEYHYMESFDEPMGHCPKSRAEVLKYAVKHPQARHH